MSKKAWFIGASICGMLVTGSAGVYAGSKLPEIKAFLNTEVGIVIDGQQFTPYDSNGMKLYPLMYKGSNYLPVRAVSEALNVPIEYDKVNDRVLIGEQASSFVRPKYLPSDFPLPSDTKKIELVEDASGSIKTVVFTLQTKQSLKQLSDTYEQYLQKRGYTTIFNDSSDTTIDITGNVVNSTVNESTVIEGKVIDSATKLSEYTITWSTL